MAFNNSSYNRSHIYMKIVIINYSTNLLSDYLFLGMTESAKDPLDEHQYLLIGLGFSGQNSLQIIL